MQRIFLFAPPMIMPVHAIRRITEHLPLLALGSYLQRAGYAVRCVDMACDGYDNLVFTCQDGVDSCIYGSTAEDLFAQIDAFGPDIIGMSVVYTFQDGIAIDIAHKLRARYPSKVIIAGGHAVEDSVETYLHESQLDYLVLGEGEYRLERLFDNLSNGHPAETEMDGIAFLRNGAAVVIPPTKIIQDINALPQMDRSLLNQEKYLEIGRPQALFSKGSRPTTLFVGKGCPMRCTFCNNLSISGRTLRYRSVDSILDEVRYLKDIYDVDEIQFYCENLTADKKWARELFEGLIPLKVSWCTPVGLFFNTIDAELLELMQKSGAYQVTFAIESANKRVLNELMHKPVALERVKEMVDKAHSLGIAVHGFFMIGMPGETREEIQNTLRFPFEANFDSISMNVVNAYRPSPLYDLCVERGYLAADGMSIEATSTTNIAIPEDSPDFSYTAQQLSDMAREVAERHFEWSKTRFPEIWERKYKPYLARHPEDAEAIKGRI